jgi:hypothetical protein
MYSESEEDPGQAANGVIDVISASLSFETEILTNLYYTVSGFEPTEMGLLTWSAAPEYVSIDTAEQVYTGAQFDEETGRYMVSTDGISAKNMGDDIFMVVYAKTAEGELRYSDVITYSPKQYAMSRLEKSQDPALKALCVAMLNYGAEAQHYFGYKTDTLMNADLTEEQKAMVRGYSAELLANAKAVDAAQAPDFVKTEGYGTMSATMSMDGSLTLNYYLHIDEAAGDVTMYVWTSEKTVFTADNAQVITMTNVDGQTYWSAIEGIAAKEMDDS